MGTELWLRGVSGKSAGPQYLIIYLMVLRVHLEGHIQTTDRNRRKVLKLEEKKEKSQTDTMSGSGMRLLIFHDFCLKPFNSG